MISNTVLQNGMAKLITYLYFKKKEDKFSYKIRGENHCTTSQNGSQHNVRWDFRTTPPKNRGKHLKHCPDEV